MNHITEPLAKFLVELENGDPELISITDKRLAETNPALLESVKRVRCDGDAE